MYSSLVDYVCISPNSNNPRNNKLQKITIHHMAGDLSIETCGNIFANPERDASSNYGIGTDGRVGCYVEEENRAWTSGNADNDNQAITIEVANDGGNPDWHVSDVAFNKLIKLCVDICKRNDIERINYTGNADGNLTMHCMFQPTACPGPYLKSRMAEIAHLINVGLGVEPDSVLVPELSDEEIDILARAVIRGEYGNGDERKARLGDYYDEVQDRVEEILNGDASVEDPESEVVIPEPIVEESVSNVIPLGTEVIINDGAKTVDGIQLADFVYGRVNTVVASTPDRVAVAYNGIPVATVFVTDITICGDVAETAPTPEVEPIILTTIKNGDKVTLNRGAKTADGITLADFVYDRVYVVDEICDTAILYYDGVVVAKVFVDDLTLI